MPNQTLSSAYSVLTEGIADSRYLTVGTGDGRYLMASTGISMGSATSDFGTGPNVSLNGGDATGAFSISSGEYTSASGVWSTAMGFESTASGYYSTALGLAPLLVVMVQLPWGQAQQPDRFQ